MKIFILLAAIGGTFAEAPLPYPYDLRHSNHHHGFRPSHGYPCPDGIAHRSTEGRIISKSFETPKHVTVNSQITFGDQYQGKSTYSSSKGYIQPQFPAASNQFYSSQQLPTQHGSGSIVHGIGKAAPPLAFNRHHTNFNYQNQIPIHQHRPLSTTRHHSQYLPPRQEFFQPNNFAPQDAQSGLLNTISTGSSIDSSNGHEQSGSSVSSSDSIGFTSIGSTHNFNHPRLDEGLSQVISDTFTNAGVGENVEKHIYVHVPPDDLENSEHHQHNLPVPTPKKHYKIVFIKAPNQQPSTNIYTHAHQQSEEKTLIYVLVKKPEEPTIHDIEHIQNTYKPSKPEVYFIKYKTREDHQGIGDVNSNNGNYQGSDLNGGIDIRGGFNEDSNTIHNTLASNIIEPRVPIGSNIPAANYGPPSQYK